MSSQESESNVSINAGLVHTPAGQAPDDQKYQYQDTCASQHTIRKEYKDLAEMLAKSVGMKNEDGAQDHPQKPTVSAFDKAWFGSHLGFSWVTPVIRQMYSGAMDPENLALSESEKSDTNYSKFKRNWDDELQTTSPSLLRALKKTFWKVFAKAVMLKLLWGLVLVFTMGILIRQLILFVANHKTREAWEGYVIALSFLVASLLLGFLLHHMTSWSVRLGVGVKSAVTRAIYDKSLTAKQTSTNVGDILSLISRDAAVLFQAAKAVQYLWSGPLEVAGLTGFCAYYVGVPAVWIAILCGITVPLQYLLGMAITNIRERNVLSNTERLLIIHEILYAIKLVKFYTWEDSFSKKIENIRQDELHQLKKAAYIKAFNLGLIFLFPPLAAVGCFYWMILNGVKLVPAVTFTILTLCNSLRFPLVMLPSGIKIVSDAKKGLKRIEEFLTSEDKKIVPEAPETGVFFENATLGYIDGVDEKNAEVQLSNVSVALRPGQVLAVVGHCGSGKTTFLKAILGDCEVLDGSVHVKGKVAYVPQNPFIMHGTVRDNITFGMEYEEEWYLEVLRACCLPSDLNTFNNGDLTYLSEGGINLSGGQRQRIALARAIYAKADIYLLDSVLSALDPATGRKCFRRCVQKLLKSSVVILVTHSLDTLPLCTLNMIVEHGGVSYIGEYNQGELAKVFPPEMLNASDKVPVSVDSLVVDEQKLAQAVALGRADSIDAQAVLGQAENPAEELNIKVPSKDKTFSSAPKAREGLKAWLSETGRMQMFLTVALFVSTQIVRIFSDYWVRFWVNDKYNQSAEWYLARYGFVIAIFGTMLCIRGVIFYVLSLKAARSFYTKLYKAIVEAPVLFFTKEPLGKILKSFSFDQDAVDDSLPDTAHITLIFFSISITTTAIVCIVIPWCALVAAFVLAAWWVIQQFTNNASNKLKTACAETNSAAVVHASESMHGVAVIRAFGQEKFMRAENQVLVDANISSVFYLEHIELWAELRVDIVAALFVFFTALMIVVDRATIKPGDAGLAISNATQLLVFMALMVQGFGDVFFQMYSVVRIDEYIKKTPSEDFTSSLEMPMAGGKPCFPNGKVDVQNIFVAYDPMKEMVLKNVTVNVQAGERVGIVGRTGSGKTSLLNSIFRLMELIKGKIEIDGLNIRELDIRQLREALCIIPQEPVLFKGTFRSNLDPFGEYTDEELWNALELSHMKEYVMNTPDQLNTEIVEGGQNISIGQKQLLCLTRVILKKNCKILVLDEATSALDPHTDQLIQESIRNVFKTQTILTIAHRLDTIKDYDKIMVLHFGELMEYDSVDNLLQKENGYFRALYESHSSSSQ
jgi:ABC-type multidrug transport system fused ATPase/permease subunit